MQVSEKKGTDQRQKGAEFPVCDLHLRRRSALNKRGWSRVWNVILPTYYLELRSSNQWNKPASTEVSANELWRRGGRSAGVWPKGRKAPWLCLLKRSGREIPAPPRLLTAHQEYRQAGFTDSVNTRQEQPSRRDALTCCISLRKLAKVLLWSLFWRFSKENFE